MLLNTKNSTQSVGAFQRKVDLGMKLNCIQWSGSSSVALTRTLELEVWDSVTFLLPLIPDPLCFGVGGNTNYNL